LPKQAKRRPRASLDFSRRGDGQAGDFATEIDRQAAERNYDNDVWEFIQACSAARYQAKRHLTWSEVFQVMWCLGYRKARSWTET
jgi:hypothetical protein